MKQGQILILVLLIVVVTLAVGLSVASRNITNLRTATQTEHSQRAFSAAEGGVEHMLSIFNLVAPYVGEAGYSENLSTEGGITGTVTLKKLSGYEKTIELGEVGQVDLNGATAGSVLTVEWAKKSDPAEGLEPASIEIVQISGTGAPYSQTRVAYSGFSGRDEQGFSSPAGCTSTNFEKCVTVTISSNAKILRIRPFWEKTTVKVSGGTNLPVQMYDVTSTASTDLGLTRKVQITKSALPLVPAVFDFAMYSESDLVK